jgi:hypothetical protein
VFVSLAGPYGFVIERLIVEWAMQFYSSLEERFSRDMPAAGQGRDSARVKKEFFECGHDHD